MKGKGQSDVPPAGGPGTLTPAAPQAAVPVRIVEPDPVMDRFGRPVGRPKEVLLRAVEFSVAEKWLTPSSVEAGAENSISPGVLHRLSLPPEATERTVWLAFHNSDSQDDWGIRGKLRFLLNGAVVGEFPFENSAALNTLGNYDFFVRPLIVGTDYARGISGYSEPYAVTGHQPPLELIWYDGESIYWKTAYLQPWDVRVTADTVEYVVDSITTFKTELGVKVLATGLRVLSQYPR